MKIFLIVVVSVVVLIGLFYIVLIATGPKKSDYQGLTEPRIIEKQSITALVVEFNGDPNKVIKEAFGRMYKKYYSLKGLPKGNKQPYPIARYSNFDDKLNFPEADMKGVPWSGYTAVQVPSGTPKFSDEYVKLKTVDYGKVAEIVHFGPYQTEVDNINRLKLFIKDSGYEISGMHEEEYIIGPGLFYRSPKSYITIIRYQIK